MAQKIDEDAVELLFGSEAALLKRVQAFQKAIERHATTVGEAAPTEHPFVEKIVKGPGKGEFEIVPKPKEPEPEVLEFVPIQDEPVPELTFEEKKNNKLRELSWERDDRIARGVRYKARRFKGDALSVNALMAALAAEDGGSNFLVRWKAAEGEYMDLERADIVALLRLVRKLIQDCFDHEFNRASLLRTVKSEKDLAKFDPSSGWPE